MKKLNNKGYMLVEIILASVIAMGMAYFMFELIIKLKNKNDDLLVKTLVSTDQTIIYNTIMDDIYENGFNSFSCDKIKLEGNKFMYDNEFTNLVSDYATLGNLSCDKSADVVKINLPISVKQLDDNFDVVIDYQYAEPDMVPPVCTLDVSDSGVITATYSDDESGISNYLWNFKDSNGSVTEKGNDTALSITSAGTYIFTITDRAGNEGSCSISAVNTVESLSCPSSYPNWDGSRCFYTSDTASKGYYCYCYKANSGNLEATGSSSTVEGCRSWCRGIVGDKITLGYEAYYACSSGTVYPLASGGAYCKHTTSSGKTTTYSCPEGYTNEVNDSYCWKVVE